MQEVMREILVKPGHVIIGQIEDGHIHVADIIHGGISEVSLTGQKPGLHPIPVGEIEAIRKKHGLNKLLEPDPKQHHRIEANPIEALKD
jgi:hypothetical protein